MEDQHAKGMNMYEYNTVQVNPPLIDQVRIVIDLMAKQGWEPLLPVHVGSNAYAQDGIVFRRHIEENSFGNQL
jgi:hypothetical protein